MDLCLVADGAERQLEAAARWRDAMWPVHSKVSFTLIPISPARLGEKQVCGDFFSTPSFGRGCRLPLRTDSNNPSDWLRMAEADPDGIRRLVADEIAYSMCRSKLAEVLEKTLKAELIRLGWSLVKTLDLLILGTTLGEKNSDLVAEARPLCTGLAEAYFTGRYPGFDVDEPDWPRLRGQLQQVEVLVAKVRSRLNAVDG